MSHNPTSNQSDSRTGGCWTCRIRRKKCDEEHGEDDACATCRRLKIDCLGWGSPKPDWMKDKEAVENYKAQIKAQLMRTGRIRGQPKLSPNSQIPHSRGPHPYLQRSNSAKSIPTTNLNASPTASRSSSAPQARISNPSAPILPPTLPITMPPRMGVQNYDYSAARRHSFDAGFYYPGDSSSTSASTSSGGGRGISQSPVSNSLHITPSQQPPFADYNNYVPPAVSPDPCVEELASLLHPNTNLGFSPQAFNVSPDSRSLQHPAIPSPSAGSSYSPYSPYGAQLPTHLDQNAFTASATSATATSLSQTGPAYSVPIANGLPPEHLFHIGQSSRQLPATESHLGLKLNTVDLGSEQELTPMQSASVSAGSNPANMSPRSVQEKLIAYYLDRNVFCSHLPLATASEKQEMFNVFREVIREQPGGPVALAACALAGLHASRTNGSRDFNLDPSLTQYSSQFFTSAYRLIQERVWQSTNNHPQNLHSTVSPPALSSPNFFQPSLSNEQISTSLTEPDILASMQLFQFLLFSGETPKNFILLNLAHQWLEQSPIMDSKPLQALSTASPLTRTVVKLVIWTDIFSSVSLRTKPRLDGLYQRILENYDFAPSGFDVFRMNSLIGCPDDIVLAYADIAILEAKGDQRRAAGSLSIMAFVERAKAIEKRLQRQTNKEVGNAARNFATSSPAGSVPPSSSPQVYFSPLSPPTTATSVGSPASVHLDSFSTGVGRGSSRSPAATNYAQSLLQESRESEVLISEIFRAGAFVYLYTVLNGHNPNVPEIRESVQSVISLLKRLPITPSERGLILPIFLAGCLVDDPLERSFFRNRLSVQDPSFGSIAHALRMMENIWTRRDLQGPGVDWRTTVNDLGSNLLLL